MIADLKEQKVDMGLLVLRVLIGFMFILHGAPKLFGGTETWTFVGSSMEFVGLKSGFAFWGLMAALAEFAGGLLLIIGLFVRPASLFLLGTMIVAILFHFGKNEGFNGASHAMEDAVVFVCLFITGGGKFALDAMMNSRFGKFGSKQNAA